MICVMARTKIELIIINRMFQVFNITNVAGQNIEPNWVKVVGSISHTSSCSWSVMGSHSLLEQDGMESS